MATGGLLIVFGILFSGLFISSIFEDLKSVIRSKFSFLFRYGPFNTPVESLCTGVYSHLKIKTLV